MHRTLQDILEIQELDMKMIRLMRVKKERQKELRQIDDLRSELRGQLVEKEKEIAELSRGIVNFEQKIQEVNEKTKRLESQQVSIKKADEFNALTQEMTAAEREKGVLEQKVSDLVDKRVAEEEYLEKVKESLKISEESSAALEQEVRSGICLINEEGAALQKERTQKVAQADVETLAIYERLLHNKKDRVVVPIENRTCSGCHIVLTAQHENLVRKGNNIVFCEHCSRIHYWQDSQPQGDASESSKKRRRKVAAS